MDSLEKWKDTEEEIAGRKQVTEEAGWRLGFGIRDLRHSLELVLNRCRQIAPRSFRGTSSGTHSLRIFSEVPYEDGHICIFLVSSLFLFFSFYFF